MPAQAFARTFYSLVGITLLAAADLFANGASARDFEIRYHERFEPIYKSTEQISFVAYGRQFDLLLESNNGIFNVPSPERRHHTTALYRGRLETQANSWVRLSESNGRISGAIWDGDELWLIDSQDRLADYLLNIDPATGTGNVIFRLSEVSGSLGDLVGDVVANIGTDASDSEPEVALATFGPQPGRVLDIGIVATSDFGDRHGANADQILLEMFNVVEGIFITQVGVQLRAVDIAVLDTTPTDLQESDPQTLLENFSAYKVRTPDLYPLGLAHLFVGRDLDDLDPPIRTVGMANLSVLCDGRYGVGITQATHATILDALIAAHEIGHNFGAPHDAEEGSVCAAETTNFIMAPQISGSTRFSQCSIETMQTEIFSAGCMRDIPPSNLQLTVDSPPPERLSERDTFTFDVVLSNLSNSHVAGVELIAESASLSRLSVNADAIDDGYCEGSSRLACVWPWFPAGASVILSLNATAASVGPATIDVSIDSLHELDPSDNALQFEFEVLPLAELLSLMTPNSADLHPGESARFEAAVVNRGNAAAFNVVAHLSLESGLELLNNELAGCTTSAEPGQTSYACPIGTLPAGQSWSFGFSARVPASVDLNALADATAAISLVATSDSVTLADADRSANATITIGESISDLSVAINGPNLVEPGEETVWEIELINHGPDPATSVRVVDTNTVRTLPADNVSIEADKGDCLLTGDNVEFSCEIGALAVGERTMIRLTATARQQGQYFWIEASAQSPAPDGDRTNDQTSVLVAAGNEVLAAAPAPTDAGADASVADDSGGGGSTGILTLILLAIGIWVRSSRTGLRAPGAI